MGVAVAVGVDDGVFVAVAVFVGEGVDVRVGVWVAVGVGVAVAVEVAVGVTVGVGVHRKGIVMTLWPHNTESAATMAKKRGTISVFR